MAKFNKDTFLNDITDKVQSAIDKNLITQEDVANNDLERLHGFIQYELLEYIEDRKFAIDVLKDFNYDEKTPWANLQNEYGTFKSLMDIALVNLWKYISSEKANTYEYYNHDNNQKGKPMLDLVHDIEDIPGNASDADSTEQMNTQTDDYNFDSGFDAVHDENDGTTGIESDKPRRKIRIAK